MIYWVAKTWCNFTEQMLQKSWKLLWSKHIVIERPNQVDVKCEVLHLFKEIPGCEETVDVDTDEWLSADYKDDQQHLDPEIVLHVHFIHTRFR